MECIVEKNQHHLVLEFSSTYCTIITIRTFSARFDVVSFDWSLASVGVGPRQPEGADGFTEDQIPGPVGGALLGSGGHVTGDGAAVADGLSANGEGVADFLLQVVNKQHPLVDSLLHLLRIICNWERPIS